MSKKHLGRFTLALLCVMVLMFSLIACDPGGTYQATFESNGGSAVAAMEEIKTIETEPETTKAGYLFEGWFTKSDLSGTRVSFPYELKEDTKFYAKWREATQTYQATFVTNGGSAVATQEQVSVVKSSPRTTREEYDFDGWYLNADLSGKAVRFPYTLSGDTTFYAKWIEAIPEKPSVEQNLAAVTEKLSQAYALEENQAFKIDLNLAAGWTPSGGTQNGYTVKIKGNLDYRNDNNSVFAAEVANNGEVLIGLYYEQGEVYLQLYGGGGAALTL